MLYHLQRDQVYHESFRRLARTYRRPRILKTATRVSHVAHETQSLAQTQNWSHVVHSAIRSSFTPRRQETSRLCLLIRNFVEPRARLISLAGSQEKEKKKDQVCNGRHIPEIRGTLVPSNVINFYGRRKTISTVWSDVIFHSLARQGAGWMHWKQGSKWRDMKIAFTNLQLVKRATLSMGQPWLNRLLSVLSKLQGRPGSSLDYSDKPDALYDPK